MESAIVIENLHKSFGKRRNPSRISHEFETGKIHGIVGNNGSGKTVMMKCICGFLRPDDGRILVRDREVGKDMDFPGRYGDNYRNTGISPGVSGLKNLKIPASLRRIADERKIRETMERVGLDPDLKKNVNKYSLGMRQRLGIAQAIMEDPSILILDEPFNGLDKHGVAQIRNLIKDLRCEGRTIILASHNQADIDELCDTVCEMDDGNMWRK